MDRRKFLKGVAAAGLAPGLVWADQKQSEEGTKNMGTLERRALGATGEKLSVIGFGGIVVAKETPETAANYVAEAFDRGVNYFDVAPTYDDAQDRLGPALKPYRDNCFLACKTVYRDAEKAAAELDDSLKKLQTDHFDLYQLHGIKDVAEDVEKAFGPGGAMEAIVKAREAGKIRFIGFSAHSEEAAHAAMDHYKFDTILFPFNYATWIKGRFGESVWQRARERGMGLLALKSMAQRRWMSDRDRQEIGWRKCWYQPHDKPEVAELCLRFTLGLPVTAAIPPGHWPLMKMAIEIAQAGPLSPLKPEELARLTAMAEDVTPIFEQAMA